MSENYNIIYNSYTSIILLSFNTQPAQKTIKQQKEGEEVGNQNNQMQSDDRHELPVSAFEFNFFFPWSNQTKNKVVWFWSFNPWATLSKCQKVFLVQEKLAFIQRERGMSSNESRSRPRKSCKHFVIFGLREIQLPRLLRQPLPRRQKPVLLTNLPLLHHHVDSCSYRGRSKSGLVSMGDLTTGHSSCQ